MVEVAIRVTGPHKASMAQADMDILDLIIVRGLLDTGADRTVVDEAIVNVLGLQAAGTVLVYAAAAGGTPHPSHLFLLAIGIWTGKHTEVKANPIPVVAADFSAYPFDILIGRDVLNAATFVYDGPNGALTLKF